MEDTRDDLRGMILAAGFGTRLQNLGLKLPKPLLPICGVPLIRYGLAQMAHAGIRQVIINLHHQGEAIRRELGDGSDMGMELSYSVEEEQILGTGGGIKKARQFFGDRTFVVMNGKIVSDLDLREAVRFHREKGVKATMVVHPVADPRSWGAVEVGTDRLIRKVAGFERPDLRDGEQLEPYVFTGIQILEPGFLDAVPDGPACIVRTAYRDYLRNGADLGGYVGSGYWQDHSTPSRYLAGNLNLLGGTAKLWRGLSPSTGVDPGAKIHPEAEIRPPVRICVGASVGPGARVGPFAVVGRDCRVAAGSALERAVIWDGCEVAGEIGACVVTPWSEVRVDLEDEGAKCGPQLATGARSGPTPR